MKHREEKENRKKRQIKNELRKTMAIKPAQRGLGEKKKKNLFQGPEEMAQELRAFIVLSEDLSSIPRTHIGWITCIIPISEDLLFVSGFNGFIHTKTYI